MMTLSKQRKFIFNSLLEDKRGKLVLHNQSPSVYLRNKFNFLSVHEIINTSGFTHFA